MSDVNFTDLLNTPIDQIERPKALPVGTYICLIDGMYEVGKAGKNNTNYIDFNFRPLQAMADVNQQQLEEALGERALSDKRFRYRIFVTRDSRWKLKEFLLEHCGIGMKANMNEMLPETPGKQVAVYVGHQTSPDGIIFNQVGKTASVDKAGSLIKAAA